MSTSTSSGCLSAKSAATSEEPSDGSKRLTVDPEEVPVELARPVERSLEREDIANSVVGGHTAGGA